MSDETRETDTIQEKLVEVMWEVQNQKAITDASSVVRKWSVLYTELEKCLAYYQVMLQSKEENV